MREPFWWAVVLTYILIKIFLESTLPPQLHFYFIEGLLEQPRYKRRAELGKEGTCIAINTGQNTEGTFLE